MSKTREYKKPAELLEISQVKERFKNPRNIGYFIMLFPDKIDFIRTSRSILINKDMFINFLNHFEKF